MTSRDKTRTLKLTVSAIALMTCSAANADSIIDAWKSVAVPEPPPLHPASVESPHAALLILDMYATNCVANQRPACPATIPRIKRLLTEARARKMPVIYSTGPITPATQTPPNPPAGLERLPGELVVRTGADKFVGSDLEKLLSERGIQTIIVAGTSAEGSVLYTASGASQRKIKVVVPVDSYSSHDRFGELYTAWHLTNAPNTVTDNITLTTSDMITFK